MSVECFFDTNILVYASSAAAEDIPKRKAALELVRNEDFGLSAQVLQEFYVTVTRKIRIPILFTEDLAHGQRYGSLRVVNPFR